jgi:hypothetical protein
MFPAVLKENGPYLRDNPQVATLTMSSDALKARLGPAKIA